MYLKSIEVHGFKSFANKLVFEFHNGITGIVGPNGSGKSNVADAVRWVLGEQSAKQLRGASMQDVIFAGTELRKPQSYAYVALTISNEDHKLNVPYEEVQIARRVYRSGESEYLLNGTSCRLKDVQELFFDTGIGKEGYSIIGQGQIDKILSGKPEERRELFDEAAGIVKYKKRKATAEKNLEAESQNLLRVKDILAELEKQVGPLEKQSEKAREYLKLKDDLKKYEINLFIQDYNSFQEELDETSKNIDNTQKELKNAKDTQDSTKAEFEDVERLISEFDKKIEAKKEKKNKDQLTHANLQTEVLIAKEKIASLSHGKEYYAERMSNIQDGINEAQNEKKDYIESQEQFKEQLTSLRQKEQELDAKIQSSDESINQMNETISAQNELILSSMNQSSKIQVEHQKIKSMMEQNSIRKAELNQKILLNKSQVSTAVEQMKSEEEALNDIRKKMDVEYVARKNILKQAEKIRGDIHDVQSSIQQEQKEFHIKSSRLATMKNITERYDGYGQSIRRVMEQKKDNEGIVGVVADIIQVDKKYETAVETALGGNIQNIVTENEHEAKKMIDFLKKNHYGRATFLPLTTVTPKPGSIKQEALEEEGVIGIVSSLVEKEERFTNVIEFLLGRYILVDTIEHAMRIGKKYRYSLRIVTLEGELLSPGGSMSGGSFKNNNNLLGRRREMEKLEKEIETINQSIIDLKSEIKKYESDIEKTEQDAKEKAALLKELEINANTANIKYEQAVAIKEQKEAEFNAIISDGKEIEEQKNVLEDTIARIDEQLHVTTQQSDEAKILLEQTQKDIEQAEKDRNDLTVNLGDLRMEISSFSQKNAYLLENLERTEGRLAELKKEYDSLLEEQNNSDTQVDQMNTSIEECEKRIGLCIEEIDSLEEEIKELIAKKDELMFSQKDFFEKRNDMMEHIGELDKEAFRLTSRKEKIQEQLDAKMNYMWSEYELTYHNALDIAGDIAMTYTRVKYLVNDTKSSIKALGDVNVNAIDDYKSVSERYELLKTQHDDLIESEEALKAIISDLDVEMRKQFNEKFALIKEQFDKVFRELFGGGKGTLELVEEEDVLVAGIRIIAQPPGKKLQNMMQLSGGEKALTAIALLFAIQNLKPSPFCLLDEIEAALDDSNVKRYAKYLHKLTKNTQFIVITHRQGTMSAADALYGITMQEKGVSTLVSVKLIEEQLKDEDRKAE